MLDGNAMKASPINGTVSTAPPAIGKRRAGLKPGQKHSGSFKPGHDPRRNLLGPRMSKEKVSFMEACREMTENALSVLAEAMNDGNAAWRDRTSAAALLLEHGHGKPVDRIAVANLSGNLKSKDPKQLTTKELFRIIEEHTCSD
jgi:hypothetical protein